MSVREQTRTFDQVEAFSGGVFTMLGAGEPREVRGTNVSDGLLTCSACRSRWAGRYCRGENQPGHDRVAVLDHGFWQRQFGGDRDVIGRTVSIAGAQVEIVGVLARAFAFRRCGRLPATGVRRVIQATTAKARRGEFLTVIARAKPGPARARDRR